MVNLLKDTRAALHHFNKFTSEVNAIVFFNEDLNQLQQMEWSEFKLFADDVEYDPFGVDEIGMRIFKSRFFIVGDDWYLARTTEKDDYEGWVFYDHQLEVNLDELDSVVYEDDILAFLICDIINPYSNYTSDKAYMEDHFPKPVDDNGVNVFRIVHGVGGRKYWSDHAEHNKAQELLHNPTIVDMVIAGEHKNADVFNNANLSQIIGVENANYIDDATGDLTVSLVPPSHFTIYMDERGNEIVQTTVAAPYL